MSACEGCGRFESVDVWRFESGLQLKVCDGCVAAVKTVVCVGMVTPVAYARRGDPDTSKLAARSVNVTQGQNDVYLLISAEFGHADDFTLDDLVSAAERRWTPHRPWTPSGLRSRCRELVGQGKVIIVGRRRLPTGRSARLHRFVG